MTTLYVDPNFRQVDLAEVCKELPNEMSKLDMLKAVYGYSNGYDLPESSNMLLTDFADFETAKEARTTASQFHTYINKGKKQEENLALAIAERDRIMSSLSSLTPEEMKSLGDNMDKLLKVIDSEGKVGFAKGDDGKIVLKGSGTRSGNGDRSNPLPPIEETDWIMRGNGKPTAEAVLMVKTDVLKGTGEKKGDLFIPGMWQAFHKPKNENKYTDWGSLGKVDGLAYSTLNLACNNRVQENEGKSIGVSGLKTVELDEVIEILKQAGFELA